MIKVIYATVFIQYAKFVWIAYATAAQRSSDPVINVNYNDNPNYDWAHSVTRCRCRRRRRGHRCAGGVRRDSSDTW